MLIRKATAEEMLKLWGYKDEKNSSPTAKFFYSNICSGNAVFWTIDNDETLIGELYVFLDIKEDKYFADGKMTAYLCAFRVKKEYRGLGFGSKLMETALADLKEKGFRRATIGVSDERNEKFYRRMGFDTKIKDCFSDPCARNENLSPVSDEKGYTLLLKDL
ncbi:MAG: GNAT family N-acetyltransferase [Clostridia bacterium]|nr:GNAT family N-acetyltransferase [Clostridia bacterium]